ncbi:hypothetical protein niasHT_035627 [Heterodera trifolii]|uniref:Major facilitator superfamily (MFS) profile domain-containing protein n=1 Tax=Heterodera trifolii TaxID=157864 RepID=A0ABD2I2V0_9BILA
MFKELTNRQLVAIVMLAISNLCSTVVVSCIGPIYPGEAKRRGMSEAQIGLVFGLFQLVMFISAPLLGKYMHVIGSKWMCIAGLQIASLAAIAFGTLNWIHDGFHFFWASLFIRFIEALGEACFLTASLAIKFDPFPFYGFMETVAGFGFTVGPLIGGVLYDNFGGFQMPFFVLGTLLLAATIPAYFLIDEVKDDFSEDPLGMFGMLKIPSLWLMVFAVVLCAISLSFLDPILSGHLQSFGFTHTKTGLMFFLCDGSYCLTATLWGVLLDRWNCNNFLMFFGSSATIVSLVLFGVVEKRLEWICISLAILGIASGALYIPSFQQCLDVVKKRGYDDSFQTYGCVSGLIQSSYALGGFMGPTVLGGWGCQKFGLRSIVLSIVVINLIFIFALLSFLTAKRFCTATTYFVDEAHSSIIIKESSRNSLETL